MNEVYNDVLGKALSIKSTNNIVVKVEQGALEVNLKQCSVVQVMCLVIIVKQTKYRNVSRKLMIEVMLVRNIKL